MTLRGEVTAEALEMLRVHFAAGPEATGSLHWQAVLRRV